MPYEIRKWTVAPILRFYFINVGGLGIRFQIMTETYYQRNKSQKGLPLETKNTQNHENRRVCLIESLHMQHCKSQRI